MKVVILGAGIGGLTTAHELCKFNSTLESKNKLEIHIYERNINAGGQARSQTDIFDNIDYEYCWHAIGNGYINLIELLSEIYVKNESENESENEKYNTVLSHLKPITKYYYARNNDNKEDYYEDDDSFMCQGSFWKLYKGIKMCNSKLSCYDLYVLMKIYLKFSLMNKKDLEKYDSITWVELTKDLSEEAKKWIVYPTSIFLGMDYNKLNAHLILDMWKKGNTFLSKNNHLNPNYTFYAFDESMHKIWFEPWVQQLKDNGVFFHFDTEIEKIITNPRLNSIDSIKINTSTCQSNYSNDSLSTYQSNNIIKADIFVNALPIESLAKCLPNNQRFTQLANSSKQLQTQVLYCFNEKIKLPQSKNESKNETNKEISKENSKEISKNAIILFPDSPWYIMTKHEGNIRNLKNQDYLSAGIGIWDKEGLLIRKKAINCSHEELAIECWYQMLQSRTLMDKLILEKSNRSLAELYPIYDIVDYLMLNTYNQISIPKYKIWYSYLYNINSEQIETFEPKFSNNINTLKSRPYTQDDKYTNLKHATAYVRTDMNIFCMESAVEAGKKAALSIINNYLEINN